MVAATPNTWHAPGTKRPGYAVEPPRDWRLSPTARAHRTENPSLNRPAGGSPVPAPIPKGRDLERPSPCNGRDRQSDGATGRRCFPVVRHRLDHAAARWPVERGRYAVQLGQDRSASRSVRRRYSRCCRRRSRCRKSHLPPLSHRGRHDEQEQPDRPRRRRRRLDQRRRRQIC